MELLIPYGYLQKGVFRRSSNLAQSVVVAESISNDPNKLWKTRSANNKTRENIATISEIQWYSYFMNQFAEPDAKKCENFESELNDRLFNPGPGAFVVSTKDLSEVI